MLHNHSIPVFQSEKLSVQSKLIEAYTILKNHIPDTPDVGLVLGSGLGELPNYFLEAKFIPFESIPHFPVSKVKGHKGQFVYGKHQGKTVLAMQGRVHYYEGYSMQEVTFGIRLMQKLGIEKLIVTNASGGLHSHHKPGSLCFIEDHINLMNANPLRGENLDEFGVRFPDMSQAYDLELLKLGKKWASELDLETFSGVYAGVSGPNYETPSEIKYLQIIGADMVGMSTVPEVIVAVHGGMKVLGISCITDVPVIEGGEMVTHESVIEAAKSAQKDFIRLTSKIIEKL